MKLARFVPIAASLTAVGLVCVMLTRAESKPPAPADAPPSDLEALGSPSDGVRLTAAETHACATKACATKACAKACATKACATKACAATTCAAGQCATTACATGECSKACDGAAKACTQESHPAVVNFPLPPVSPPEFIFSWADGMSVASPWTCAATCCETACEAGACTPAMTVAAGEVDEGCACPKKCCCGEACACGEASAHAALAWGVPGPRFGYHPHPAFPAWGPTPPMPHMDHPPYFPPMHDAPPPHLHPQLAEAMIENARLAAHNEAWGELQRRQQETTNLAVENAQLRAQIELATHKEKMFDKMAEVLVQNATLTSQLEAVQERQELLQAVMEVATEKAKLEATVEAMEMHVETHLEMLNTILEAKDELTAPLHEALVENAALKAAAEAQEETAALQARIADLERTFEKLSSTKNREAAPVAKTAKKPGSETIAE